MIKTSGAILGPAQVWLLPTRRREINPPRVTYWTTWSEKRSIAIFLHMKLQAFVQLLGTEKRHWQPWEDRSMNALYTMWEMMSPPIQLSRICVRTRITRICCTGRSRWRNRLAPLWEMMLPPIHLQEFASDSHSSPRCSTLNAFASDSHTSTALFSGGKSLTASEYN
jgi:hypothetical protein